MTDLPTIRVGEHRGKPAFIWKKNRKPQYRVIKPGNQNKQLQDLLRELDEAPIAKTKRLPLATHIDDFITVIVAKHGQERGDLLRARIERIVATTKAEKLTDLTLDKLDVALADMTWANNPKRLLSEQSKNHYRATMRQFTRWLKRNKRTRELLLEEITLPEVQIKPNQRDRFQPEEADKLVNHALGSERVYHGYDGVRRAWLYRLALLTGLRRGELAVLTPKHVRLAEQVIVVSPGDTKNGKKAECPLPPEVLPELSAWLREHGKNERLFPGLEDIDTRDFLSRDMRDAGIPRETDEGIRCFHSLRNTYISQLWDLRLPGPLVQDLARHSKMELTAKYNRHKDGARAAAVAGLPVPGMSRGEYGRGGSGSES
jgi:integrase